MQVRLTYARLDTIGELSVAVCGAIIVDAPKIRNLRCRAPESISASTLRQ